MDAIKITPPLDDNKVMQIRAGTPVYITGKIYTARDAAHKRMLEDLKKGKPLPFDPKGQIIYYVGPTPPKPGQIIGSAGPTTSIRMDPYTPQILEIGIKATIGKGARGEDVISAMKKFKAIYLLAVGGAAALIAKSIRNMKVIAYEDLGPEAIRELEVEDFPTICAIDAYGKNLFKEGVKMYSLLKQS